MLERGEIDASSLDSGSRARRDRSLPSIAMESAKTSKLGSRATNRRLHVGDEPDRVAPRHHGKGQSIILFQQCLLIGPNQPARSPLLDCVPALKRWDIDAIMSNGTQTARKRDPACYDVETITFSILTGSTSIRRGKLFTAHYHGFVDYLAAKAAFERKEGEYMRVLDAGQQEAEHSLIMVPARFPTDRPEAALSGVRANRFPCASKPCLGCAQVPDAASRFLRGAWGHRFQVRESISVTTITDA